MSANQKKKITIYTDGACSGNPGVGGWAAVLSYGTYQKEICGAEKATTNNRMEVTAIIEGFKMLKEKCAVTLYSDSSYALNPFLNNWIESWQNNGWRTADKKPVKNVDLWQELLAVMQGNDVEFVWVKGHANNTLNNRCDALARGAILKLQKELIKDEDLF